MEKVFISLGRSCDPAEYLNKLGLRKIALPFDWVAAYSGVSKAIKDRCEKFLPNNVFINSHGNRHPANMDYNMLFTHHSFPQSNDSFKRRIDRFYKLLESTDKQLIFFKAGHGTGDHGAEAPKKYDWPISNDIIECEEIYDFLKEEYPNLNFQIELLPTCEVCYQPEMQYKSEKINIHNMLSQGQKNGRRFFIHKCMNQSIPKLK